MSESKKSIIDGISQEEFEQMLDEAVERMAMEERKKIENMHKKGETVFNEVFDYVKEGDSIDADDILYFPENYPFSLDEFMDLFQTMINYLDEKGHTVDEEILFVNKQYYVEHKGILIEFFTMWGQGSASIVKKSEMNLKEIDPKIVGNLEGYKEFIKEQYEKSNKEK